MTVASRATVGALTACLLVTGCSADADTPTSPASAAASASPEPSVTPSTSATPEYDEIGQQAAVDEAVATLRAFVADLPYDQWWAQLAPRLTPTGRQAYETVEPSWIPASRVDDAQLSAYPDGTSAIVLVSTDIGQYQVQLIRETAEYPWQVERITPPEGY